MSVLELIAGAALGSLVPLGVWATGLKLPTKRARILKDGTIHRKYKVIHEGYSYEESGYLCPACDRWARNRHGPYCTCEEFWEGHFHFTCSHCEFKGIMRTADK